MPHIHGLPLHAALVHFPVAASFFALVSLSAGVLVPPARRRPWLSAATLLLVATAVSGIAAVVTGRGWADASGLLPAGGWLPARGLKDGLPFRHALLGLSGTLTSLVSGAAAFRAWRSGRGTGMALFLALVTTALVFWAGHAGGLLVHTPEPTSAGSAPRP